ncbi:hypothetical protein BJ878DRAFT_529435 [Calycina marina]|uniref:Uncharacterized protein n=1 Tax=Calycina marina TaxID=1763456 RepID=A0A9P8CAW2_9HELO|nr:hypothetical protein BJ878DRAFT_529435 [Calycina marina]
MGRPNASYLPPPWRPPHSYHILTNTTVGAGFLCVPYPRMYNMPRSNIIPGDHELAEIYSLSMTHQLHYLAHLPIPIISYYWNALNDASTSGAETFDHKV